MDKFFLAAGLIAMTLNVANAEEHTVTQQGLAFDRASLTVKVGDSVPFVNQDAEFHNIFSLSDTATFDLGSFGQGESRSHVFDAPGEVEVECAIHPDMIMTIEVAE